MQEIIKKGKTYIVSEKTLGEFKVEYNQPSYRIGSGVDDTVGGYVLTDGQEDYWFVSKEYLEDNYDLVERREEV